jgi:DNA helicase-2/ATP-dependent DNA helicase PcrA
VERRRDNARAGAADALKPANILDLFFKTFGYFEYLENNFINADERMENIEELVKFVEDFENLAELLEKLSLLQSTDEEAANGDGALLPTTILATVHLAKGLEFDTVFIIGTAEGLLPHGRSIDSESQLEEERRLMYVAMTRARKKLNISFYGMASRFINEIPEQYVQLEKSGDEEITDTRRNSMRNIARNDFYKPATDEEEFIELD